MAQINELGFRQSRVPIGFLKMQREENDRNDQVILCLWAMFALDVICCYTMVIHYIKYEVVVRVGTCTR